MHTKLKTAEINVIRYMKHVKTEFFFTILVLFSKKISNANILAPVRDNLSIFLLRGRPESQLWRQHPNLFLPANQDDLTLKQFYCPGFISELQRFFWHIVNTLTLNIFGVLQFPIDFALQIIWTFVWYDHMIWLKHMCMLLVLLILVCVHTKHSTQPNLKTMY